MNLVVKFAKNAHRLRNIKTCDKYRRNEEKQIEGIELKGPSNKQSATACEKEEWESCL